MPRGIAAISLSHSPVLKKPWHASSWLPTGSRPDGRKRNAGPAEPDGPGTVDSFHARGTPPLPPDGRAAASDHS